MAIRTHHRRCSTRPVRPPNTDPNEKFLPRCCSFFLLSLRTVIDLVICSAAHLHLLCSDMDADNRDGCGDLFWNSSRCRFLPPSWGVTWNLAMACNQVRNFQCMNYQGLNCFDMSNFNHLVLTQRAIAQLDSRFEAYAHKNLMY